MTSNNQSQWRRWAGTIGDTHNLHESTISNTFSVVQKRIWVDDLDDSDSPGWLHGFPMAGTGPHAHLQIPRSRLESKGFAHVSSEQNILISGCLWWFHQHIQQQNQFLQCMPSWELLHVHQAAEKPMVMLSWRSSFNQPKLEPVLQQSERCLICS